MLSIFKSFYYYFDFLWQLCMVRKIKVRERIIHFKSGDKGNMVISLIIKCSPLCSTPKCQALLKDFLFVNPFNPEKNAKK